MSQPIRQTKAKQTVASLLERAQTPLSLAEIYRQATGTLPNIAFSTVYRIVRSLEAAGQLVAVDWRERGSRFEWAKRAHHHHIVCQDCQAVTDVPDALLGYDQTAIEQQTGYRISHHAIELTGRCPGCQTAEQAA